MKKVLVTVALLTGFWGMAQEEGRPFPKGERLKGMSVEQMATLQTKKMTLALDLSPEQYEQVLQLNMAHVAQRKAKRKAHETAKGERKKPSADERFEMASVRLDNQLAQQQQLKNILTEEQYALWKQIRITKHSQGKKRFKGKERRG